VGTLVQVHGISGYEVEFMTLGGETLVVVSLSKKLTQCPENGHLFTVRCIKSVSKLFGGLLNLLGSSLLLNLHKAG
jgi:hypothetical protein